MTKRSTWKGKKYRKIYKFDCTNCTKTRYTFDNEIKKAGVCRGCKKSEPHPDQASLGI